MLIKNHLSAPKSLEWLDKRVTPCGKEGAWCSGELLHKERACGPHWGRCWIIALTWECEGQLARKMDGLSVDSLKMGAARLIACDTPEPTGGSWCDRDDGFPHCCPLGSRGLKPWATGNVECRIGAPPGLPAQPSPPLTVFHSCSMKCPCLGALLKQWKKSPQCLAPTATTVWT